MFQCKQGRIDSGLQTEAPSAIPHSNWGRAPRDKFTSPSWPTLAHGEDLGWFISSGYKAGARKARSLVQVQGEEQGRELNWLCTVVTDCVSALSECLVHSWKECGVWAAGSWPVGHTAIFKLVLQDCNLHGLWVPDGQGDSLVWPLSCGTPMPCGSWLWDWPVSPQADAPKELRSPTAILWSLYELVFILNIHPLGLWIRYICILKNKF